MNTYHHSSSPVKVGHIAIKSRVFMSPVSTNLADKGYITDELVQHYEARTKGGVGLIVTEVTTVELTYIYLPRDVSIRDNSSVPGWKKLADAVHQYGTKILPQLSHPAYMTLPIPGTPRLIAPSNVEPSYAKETPRPVTIEELKVIIHQLGEAALHVKQARGDGVGIHAAHAHGLLGGFLTPLYNKRCDEYGGDINGGLKLTLEVVEEARSVRGPGFIIDVRISGDEYSNDGLNLGDIIYVSKQLEAHGADVLHISGGTTIKHGSAIPAAGTKPRVHAHLPQEIKEHVSIPVATVGRIAEPWITDELIANGKAGICMIGHANLYGPDFANKAKCGKDDDIRPCIGCLRYLSGIMFDKRVACTVNPSFKLENEDTLKPAEVKKKILIIGRRPAGMEAAFVAKRKGRHVILCERSDTLRGLMKLAVVPITRRDLSRVIKYAARHLMWAGAEVRLSCKVERTILQGKFADYGVITSSGAVPSVIKAFIRFKQWTTTDDILTENAFPGKNIIIPGGGSIGCETAGYLTPPVYDRYPGDRVITVLEMAKDIMVAGSGPGRSLLIQHMLRRHVNLIYEATVEKVEKDKIYYTKNGRTERIGDADTLILAAGYHSDPALKLLLEECSMTYHMIGDTNYTRTIKDAIHDGYEIARSI